MKNMIENIRDLLGYESVMGHGTIEFVSENERFAALKILMRHYHEDDFEFNTAAIPQTEVLKMTVTDFTAKRRNNVH